MKAGVVHARDDIRYEDIEKPEPGPGEVRVKVKFTGICGSDVPRVNGDASHFYPNVLGHEYSGVIDTVGEGVTTVTPGDKVAGIPLIPCMECDDCQKGDYSLCKHYTFIGSRKFGSFAEYVVVPEANVMKFDETIPFEKAAFFEPATIGLHGLERTGYKGGGTVAIIGGGTIGMMTLEWAKIFGSRKLVCFDVLPDRLELGKKLGADYGINSMDADFMDQAMAITDGKGFDYVYETAGSAITTKMAFDLVANKGHVCCIGTPKSEVVFPVDQWEKLNRKEFTLTGSWMSYSAPFPGHEWTDAAHYIGTGEFKIDDDLIYEVVPLSKIADAFAWYKERGKVKGKILIDSEK